MGVNWQACTAVPLHRWKKLEYIDRSLIRRHSIGLPSPTLSSEYITSLWNLVSPVSCISYAMYFVLFVLFLRWFFFPLLTSAIINFTSPVLLLKTTACVQKPDSLWCNTSDFHVTTLLSATCSKSACSSKSGLTAFVSVIHCFQESSGSLDLTVYTLSLPPSVNPWKLAEQK